MKQEGLLGLPVYAVGISSGGGFALMLPHLMELRVRVPACACACVFACAQDAGLACRSYVVVAAPAAAAAAGVVAAAHCPRLDPLLLAPLAARLGPAAQALCAQITPAPTSLLTLKSGKPYPPTLFVDMAEKDPEKHESGGWAGGCKGGRGW